jgi:hypothetical protein
MRRMLMAIALVLAAATTTAQETNMRATIDGARVYKVGNRHFLSVWGWAVGNGFTPGKVMHVDGVNVDLVSWERHDVCDRLVPHGWTCDDGVPKLCDASGTEAPCPACVGLMTYVEVSPGPHRVTLCATGKSGDIGTTPPTTCDEKIVQ